MYVSIDKSIGEYLMNKGGKGKKNNSKLLQLIAFFVE